MTTSSLPLRVGIVGLGAIGTRLLSVFGAHPDVVVTAVTDIDASRTERAAAQVGASAVTDGAALVGRDDVDLVYVAVPPAAHHDLLIHAVGHGKHVLCEKPLAMNAAEGREMLAAVRAAGVVHAMQLPLYFSAGVTTFVERVAAGEVGEVRRAGIDLVFPEWPRAWQQNDWIGRREQGGPIRECGPHLFEVVERALGPVRRVYADVVYPDDGVSCERSAAGVLELHSGLRVDVRLLTHVTRPETVDLTVYGERGTLGLRNWATPVFSADSDAPAPIAEVPARPGLVDRLVAAVRGEPSDLPGLEVGLRLGELQDAWEASAASGRGVDVAGED